MTSARANHDVTRELLGVPDLQRLFGCSRSFVYQADRDEYLPAPIKIGRSARMWRRRELLDWLDAGAPHRSEWRWRPALPAKLDDLIRLRTQEIAALDEEVRLLKQMLAEGEKYTHVRRG